MKTKSYGVTHKEVNKMNKNDDNIFLIKDEMDFFGGFTWLLISLLLNFLIFKKYSEGIMNSAVGSIAFFITGSIFTFFKYRNHENNI